jgi:hypothetical protein
MAGAEKIYSGRLYNLSTGGGKAENCYNSTGHERPYRNMRIPYCRVVDQVMRYRIIVY